MQGQLNQLHHEIDFKSIRKEGKQVPVILPHVQDYQLAPDTYRLQHRQIKMKNLRLVMPDGFAENQSGGRMRVSHGGQSIQSKSRTATSSAASYGSRSSPT